MSVWQVTVSGLMYSQVIQNVFAVSQSGSTLTELQVAALIDTWWVDVVRTAQVNDLVYNDVRVKLISPSAGPPQHLTINKPGTLFGFNQSISFVAIILRLKTAVAGKRGRGRLYMVGYESGQNVQDGLGPNALNLWNAKVNILKTNFLGATPSSGLNIGVMKRTQTDFTNFIGAVDIQLRQQFGVQRRRNAGVGI